MSCSIYQCSIPKKSYIYALISRIPLSDIEIDYLRAKSSDLGVNGMKFWELMYSKYVAPLLRSDPIGRSKPNPGCSDND